MTAAAACHTASAGAGQDTRGTMAMVQPRRPARQCSPCGVRGCGGVLTMRWEGAIAMSVWLGQARPASKALPTPAWPTARRCSAVPRVLGKCPPAPQADDPQLPHRRTRAPVHLGGHQGDALC